MEEKRLERLRRGCYVAADFMNQNDPPKKTKNEEKNMIEIMEEESRNMTKMALE